jgi:predicted unusual protein kinase regulating ubiquinone biosynthesis (AarF/ABC1/UbiB family)
MQTPPPGFPLPGAQASVVPDLNVSAQTWPQEAKDKFLDDLQAVQITDPKLPLSVVQRRMKYSCEYPTCLLLYTPTCVTIEQIDRDQEENEDLVATIKHVATKWTVESISAAQQKYDVPE